MRVIMVFLVFCTVFSGAVFGAISDYWSQWRGPSDGLANLSGAPGPALFLYWTADLYDLGLEFPLDDVYEYGANIVADSSDIYVMVNVDYAPVPGVTVTRLDPENRSAGWQSGKAFGQGNSNPRIFQLYELPSGDKTLHAGCFYDPAWDTYNLETNSGSEFFRDSHSCLGSRILMGGWAWKNRSFIPDYNITYHHGGEFLKWNGSSYAVYDGKDYSVIDHAWNDSLCVVFALSGFHTTSSTPYDSACYILMDENNVLSVDTCGDIYRPSCPTSWTTYNTDIVMKLSIDGDYIYAIERMTLSSQSLVRRRISSGFQVSGTLELPSFTSARNYSYTVMGDCLYLYSSDSLTAYSKDLQSRLWSKYIPNDVRHTSNQTFNYDVSLSNRNFAHQKIASSDGRLYLTTDSSLQVRSASDGSLSFEHIFTDLPEYRTNTSGATVKGLPGDVILMPDYVVICSWYDESRVWVFEQDFSDETAPDFPSGLNSSVSGYSVNLSWTASSDAESGISGYEIYRGTSPSPSTLLKTLGNYTEYTDSTGEENMVFYYRLKAVNGAGLKSGFSGETSARTAADTEAPTIVSVSASGDPNTVKVVFSENVSSETAENPTNYSIDGGITVNSASLSGGNEVFLMVSTMNEQTYTLTVNNVADLASNPNQIISGSESVFTFVAQLDVSFISYSGTNETPVLVPDGYIEDCLQALDRNDTYTGVPASLSGCTYLRTARDDKSDAAGEDVVYYEVSLSAACTVFVPCQADQPLPGWISGDGWLDGGRTVNVGSHSHNLYYKVLPSGTAGLKRTTNGSTQGTGYIFKLSSGTGIVETHGSASLQYGLPGITVSPNPFNPSTVISVTGVYVSSDSELIIYNSQGRIVSRPELTVVQRGTFCKKYIWDASGMPAGVYLATVISGSGSQSERLTKKIVLMK